MKTMPIMYPASKVFKCVMLSIAIAILIATWFGFDSIVPDEPVRMRRSFSYIDPDSPLFDILKWTIIIGCLVAIVSVLAILKADFYMIDNNGFHISKNGPYIPWNKVDSIRILNVSGQCILAFYINEYQDIRIQQNWWQRTVSKMNNAVGYGYIHAQISYYAGAKDEIISATFDSYCAAREGVKRDDDWCRVISYV